MTLALVVLAGALLVGALVCLTTWQAERQRRRHVRRLRQIECHTADASTRVREHYAAAWAEAVRQTVARHKQRL